MTEFERKIKKEVSDAVPDLKGEIKKRAGLDSHKKPAFKWQYALAPIMAVLIIAVAIFVPLYLNNGGEGGETVVADKYIMSVSVNPSVEFGYDNTNKVTSQKGLNEDGIKLLFKENFIDMYIDDVAGKLIELMNSYGYLTETSEIKVIVVDSNGRAAENQTQNVKAKIATTMFQLKLDVSNLVNMTEEELERLEDDIEKNGEEYFNQIKQLYQAEILECIEWKSQIFDEVIAIVEPRAVKNSQTVIDGEFIDTLWEYERTYNLDMDLEELGRVVTEDDMCEILEELVEEKAELYEIHEAITLGYTDDYDDLIEDIIEMVKERVNSNNRG